MSAQTALNVASTPFEVQLRCCICLDIYSDPVSIQCGHNFCLDCIEGFWDTKEQPQCPLCKETFRTRPELRVNHVLAGIVETFKRSISPNQEEEDQQEQVHVEEVPCDVCYGNKSTSVKSCLVCQASYCDLHLASHRRDPALQKHRLTDPATFTSSHLCRKHSKPLTRFCKKDQTPVCKDCVETEHRHHKVVVMEKASRRVKTQLRETKADVQQMIQTRLRKMEQIKNSVDLSKKITEKEIQSSAWVCSLLIAAVEKHQAALEDELNERQQEAERLAEELLCELEGEIRDLHTRSSELQHLELTQNPLHLLQSFPALSRIPPTKDWSEVAVHSDNCMGTVSRGVFKLVDFCQRVADNLSAEEVEKMNQYAVDVTLDPDTASGWLLLSADRKKVSSKKTKDPVTDIPKRFDSCVCVLGNESFTSGRRYWEVEVGDKPDWDVGMARESINRKGAISVRPDGGFWAICRRKGGSLSACAGPSVTLQLQKTPKKVGVFLDYEEGLVSFYDAEAKTHIHTYSGCTFTEPLYPYLNPCVQDNGKNAAPLVVCPVEGRIGEVQEIPIESHV